MVGEEEQDTIKDKWHDILRAAVLVLSFFMIFNERVCSQ